MADCDVLFDTPTEPEVLVPKASLIDRNPRSIQIKKTVQAPQNNNAIEIIKPLNQAKFPVFLAKCKSRRETFAMKVFPLEKGEPHEFFVNETRFAKLDHPNIIKVVHYENQRKLYHHDKEEEFSYTLMEYAPYGDFFDFVDNYMDLLNEKLIRTFFRQLINGLEYIHQQKAAHLDLKLENLLLGEDFKLKIADFDLSYFEGDIEILTKGTRYYRAPELMDGMCFNCQGADIYSAGVILFVLKSKGLVPHSENLPYEGIDLFALFNNNNEEFWRKHCEIQNQGPSYFSRDLKDLINGMMRFNPDERFTIRDIKESRWFNGPVYTDRELKECLSVIDWQ